MEPRLFADVDALGIAPREIEYRVAYKAVVHDHIRFVQCTQGVQREQARITGASADEDHAADARLIASVSLDGLIFGGDDCSQSVLLRAEHALQCRLRLGMPLLLHQLRDGSAQHRFIKTPARFEPRPTRADARARAREQTGASAPAVIERTYK